MQVTISAVENRPTRSKLVVSGHESFSCRYGWMPKLVEVLKADSDIFASDERAIVGLGLGKNMVRSIRFWGTVFGIVENRAGVLNISDFGMRLLDPETGVDPYLEEPGSLWKLHWNATTQGNLAAWTVLFLELKDVQITRQKFVELIEQRIGGTASIPTITAHAEMLIKCYDATRISSAVVLEDALGCPLQELNLLSTDVSAGIPIVRLARGPKAGLDTASFAYAVRDYWLTHAPRSGQLSVKSLMFSSSGPGTVFRLSEAALYERLDAVCKEAPGLTLSDDGAGGVNLVAKGTSGPDQLEDIAWRL